MATFFVFWCQALSMTPPPPPPHHKADSNNTGQFLCRLVQSTTAKRRHGVFCQNTSHKSWRLETPVCLTNPTGRCRTRPAGYCPSDPGCGPGLAVDQCGGPGLAECLRGSLHLPSWGLRENPARRLPGRPCSLRLARGGKKAKMENGLAWQEQQNIRWGVEGGRWGHSPSCL